jgi:nicotinate-nucleotide adenylyltransferase
MLRGPGWPTARAGQAIGLLGGSFDPAHAGHVTITREALRRFALNRVWWLVSPGNPLKVAGPAPMVQRLTHAAKLMRDPRVCVTDLEARLGTRYTAQTLRALAHSYPGVRFVWLMGADNLADLHRWEDWRSIADRVPVGVMARPGQRISARMSVAARVYGRYRLAPSASRLLALCEPPAWCFVNVPMRSDSSTALRAAGTWPADD